MRFVDITNDIAFRKIFGNEKKTVILISFLNAALNLTGDQRIQEVTIVNPYLLPRIAGEKASIIDVRAKDFQDRQFVIEMQVADVQGFGKRVQYYTCREYSSQIKKGEDYPKLKPTYFIGILDFVFFEGADFLSHHLILDGKTYEHKLKDIQFTFIELPKFNKQADELESSIEKWAFFLKHADDLEVIPEHVDDPGLREAYEDAEFFRWSRKDRTEYDNASMAIQDARGRIELALERGEKIGLERGMEKGIAKGMEKGLAQKTQSVVEKCWKKGMSVEEIADIAEISPEQVSRIIESLNS